MKMWQKSLVYVLPNIGWVLLAAPLAVLGGIYAKYFGLSLTTIGTVMLVARLSDALTDPLVGSRWWVITLIDSAQEPVLANPLF